MKSLHYSVYWLIHDLCARSTTIFLPILQCYFYLGAIRGLQNSVSAADICKGRVRGVLVLSEEVNPFQFSDEG